jgi:outer membrane lipoprotein-sorting protein
MIRKCVVVLSICTALLCVSSSAFAQTVGDIVAKNLAAKGGLEKLKSIDTLRSTGTMSAQGRNVSMTFTSKRPNLTRQEIVMDGQTILMVFDGKNARMINPMVSPTPVDMPAEQLEMIKDQSDIDGPLVDYKAKGTTIELVGAEMVEGKRTFHLRVFRKVLPPQDVYLDAVTYLETKVTTTVPGSGVFETQFGDYRVVEGMTMPFSIKTVAAGMTLNEMKLSTIEVNVKLDDAVFKIK